ncbi:unnamed protein product [Rotaria sp. Silwood2]|nr:unnamed protein product [Rotaria sp. Silwood2]
MNKQVDNLLEDLNKRDINDSSVKINLDKIKLLSKYFPFIEDKYKNVCQALFRKFENSVGFFKNSVLSNNFDDSTNEITKIYEALNILRDHLDYQNMENEYKRLKEYFLMYLKDSVKNLDDIFSQENLDKSDVERINNCVSILESASTTYTLLSHISKETISEVYENFLSQILKHFKHIIEKIEKELQKENSFHTLKQLVQEMDLIRTISVIKYKTNQSYYSILERLIGYVQEARRDIEQVLKTLYQEEGKVNYSRLLKSLSNLKNAKWIESYRPGVHIDVMHDVEEQIIQHVEELHRSIMDVNLDLDNFEKIEYIYIKVVEINEIKRVEKIIENVKPYIDEVNNWFETVTNDVFNIIKNTFVSKEWTEKEYQTLDFDKTEKAICYLKTCKTIRLLFNSSCTSIFDGLVIVIKQYSKFIHEDIENCFENIKEHQSHTNKELFNKARIFLIHLQEINEIKTKYPHVFSCFANEKIIEHWQNELASYLDYLSDEMVELQRKQQTEDLGIKLSVVKALSKLDSFLTGEKYNELHRKYKDIFLSQTSDVCKQVMDAINNGDYERVALEMLALESANEIGGSFLKQAKRELRDSVDRLLNKTKDDVIRGESIEIEGIKSVVDNLKQIECEKKFIKKYLSTPDEIDECILEVRRIIKDRTNRFADNIRALIVIYKFSEANQKMDALLSMQILLKKISTDDISTQIETLKQFEKDFISNIVDKYSKMDISGFILNPPKDTFEKFKLVENIKPIYKEALNTITDRILTKFRDEFTKVKIKMILDPENVRMRKFESALVYLPDWMKDTLESEFNDLKDDITSFMQDHNQKLQDVFDTGNLKTIKNMLEEYQNSESTQTFLNKGRMLTLNQVHDIVIKINEDCRKNDIREALINAKKLYDLKKELENIVSEIKQPCLEIEILIKSTCQNAFLSFIKQFRNINISVNTSEIIENRERNFICLMEFMKFKDEYRDHSVLTYILPEDFNENLMILTEKISNYFLEYKKNYDTAFQIMDMISLKNISSILSKWEFLFTKIKNYEIINNNTNTSENLIVETIKKVTPYSYMLESIILKIRETRDKLINQELINDNTKGFTKSRDQFYFELNENFCIISQINIFNNFDIDIDVNVIENECRESLERKITEIFSLAMKFLEKIFNNDELTRQDYDSFNMYYSNLKSFKQEMKVTCFMIDKKIEQIDQMFFQQIRSWELLTEQNPTVPFIAEVLIKMKCISNNVLSFEVRINEKINEILKHFRNTTKGSGGFAKLATLLNQDNSGTGQIIISEHKLFQGFSLSLFNQKIRRHDITTVLDNLKGDAIDGQKLKDRYVEFENIYRNLIKQYLKPNIELRTLTSEIKRIAGNIIQKTNNTVWEATIRNKVPILMAHIFALWTLTNADHYFDAVDTEDKHNYLLQPHTAQIVSIFRMLGIGDRNEELSNNLVEIGTGEGKSITLGVTASILALLGFDVSCACYSQYLSQRDYQAFLPLFDLLDLSNYIHYGTFNKLCEDTINENGEIRQLVERLITEGSINMMKNNQHIKRCKILLIDEVDVFFNREFYGNIYTPAASLRDPTITSLVYFIWKERQSNLTWRKIKDTDEYKSCCKKFSSWEPLILEAIKDMLSDVKSFESHDYVVNQDKIGYFEQGNIVYNIAYGYKTLFAYYYEHEKGRISKESVEKNTNIKIKCGSFSYAEIPLEFKYIMGVTGTLKTLNDSEKRIIQGLYKIRKNTFIPSVYGVNNLKFIAKDDIMIENNHDYFNTIKREITDRLVGRSSEKRAVLVIFESKHKLKEFYESEALEPIKELVGCLTEEASLEEKESLIKRATSSGQITLLPKIFGRGCDFLCHDQNVARNGGVHVIQTFLSEEVSEEVQIKGRTARQGDQGSYSMVLLYSDLEKFFIAEKDIDSVNRGTQNSNMYKTVYDLLNRKRIDLFKTQYETNMEYVKQAKDRHKIARKFLSALHSGDIDSVKGFLIEENKGIADTLNSRTICLMDATGSMSHLLHKCKNTVDIMFERASEILQDNNINSDSFQLQLVLYRNYNSRENKILQYSPWETKPDNLRTFMNTINVEGGWGNEAIEIGFWHANKEHEKENITQIILIGDASPNTKDDIVQKRECFGENYWQTTKFSQPTYYEDELAKLISNNIPVHAFFVQPMAEEKFNEIATRTGGRCKKLDINSTDGAKMLTDFVTLEILRNVGRNSNGDALAAAYENRFGKVYA